MGVTLSQAIARIQKFVVGMFRVVNLYFLAKHFELLPSPWISEEAADTTLGLTQPTSDKAVHRSSKTIRDQSAGAYQSRRRLRPNNTPQRCYSQTFGCCYISP